MLPRQRPLVLTLAFVVILFAGAAGAAGPTAEPPIAAPAVVTGTASTAPGATQIIRYMPSVTATAAITKTQDGYCWVGSIAADRPDGYRCMIGNQIHDPCFALTDGKSAVCDVDPPLNSAGFLLKLTQPLPTPEPMNQEGLDEYAKTGWLIALADGTVCSPATGAQGVVDGKAMHYYCRPAEGLKEGEYGPVLLGDLQTDKPTWLAEEARLSADDTQVLESKIITVTTVWQ
jgi:hypothetical protein